MPQPIVHRHQTSSSFLEFSALRKIFILCFQEANAPFATGAVQTFMQNRSSTSFAPVHMLQMLQLLAAGVEKPCSLPLPPGHGSIVVVALATAAPAIANHIPHIQSSSPLELDGKVPTHLYLY